MLSAMKPSDRVPHRQHRVHVGHNLVVHFVPHLIRCDGFQVPAPTLERLASFRSAHSLSNEFGCRFDHGLHETADDRLENLADDGNLLLCQDERTHAFRWRWLDVLFLPRVTQRSSQRVAQTSSIAALADT